MDQQTKHDIWLLALGTLIFEGSVAVVAVMAILAQ